MEVRIISATQTYSLRHKVLWPHKVNTSDCFIDIDDEPLAFHVGVFDENDLISIGSFFAQPSPKIQAISPYRLRAMATDKSFHQRGAGKLLIEFAISVLKQRNCDVLWCDAREIAVGFYSSLGFSKIDQPYEIPIIGKHFFMWKSV